MQVDQITGEFEQVHEEIQVREAAVPQLIQVDSTDDEPDGGTPDLLGVSVAESLQLLNDWDEPENSLVEPTYLESYLATCKYRVALQ